VDSVERLRGRTGCSKASALKALEVSKASYYRFLKERTPKARTAGKKKEDLSIWEKHQVCETARAHPLIGYKRLTWLLQNEFTVGVRAHETARVLKEANLMGPRLSVPLQLKRPSEPDRPNQVWHVDLMYVRILGSWMYLVDVVDAYSRYLVHWTLNDTMESSTVTLTIQEALEKHRPAIPPAVVHDSGSQFLSKEWRRFVEHHGMPSIRTRIAHPQSNGKVERIHRTHRTEALVGAEGWTVQRALDELERWAVIYNERRPHHALKGLPPVVYYLGDPEAALAQREQFVIDSKAVRSANAGLLASKL
jgi:putative transposase